MCSTKCLHQIFVTHKGPLSLLAMCSSPLSPSAHLYSAASVGSWAGNGLLLVARITSRRNLIFPFCKEIQLLGHILNKPIQHPSWASNGLGFYSLSISCLQMRARKNLKTGPQYMDANLFTAQRCPAKEASRTEFQSCRKGCLVFFGFCFCFCVWVFVCVLFFFAQKQQLPTKPYAGGVHPCVHTEGYLSLQNSHTLQVGSSLP